MVTHPRQLDEKVVLTVAQLNNASRRLLEETFQGIWVKGELSNVAMPRSGHIYFTLKDQNAEIRCALFKGNARSLNFKPEDGTAVLVRGSISIYEPRGDYQLIITHMEKWGLGALQQAYEALKSKLSAEGLFAAAAKKPLPKFPRHIGVITSHTGAAIQDILSVIKRRYPIAPVTVYHTPVQGKLAANEIALSIQLANKHNLADVLILSRGGGSLEDLWCFNEEIVARAIYASNIPIITGIGHEIDFTIADFVADVRAPTPSVAAETVTPDMLDLIQLFETHYHRLIQTIVKRFQNTAYKIDSLEKQLVHPGQRIQKGIMQCAHLKQRMELLMQHYLSRLQNKIAHYGTQLHAISPLATLGRGYAIVMDQETGEVIRSSSQTKPQQLLKTQVADGIIVSKVQA